MCRLRRARSLTGRVLRLVRSRELCGAGHAREAPGLTRHVPVTHEGPPRRPAGSRDPPVRVRTGGAGGRGRPGRTRHPRRLPRLRARRLLRGVRATDHPTRARGVASRPRAGGGRRLLRPAHARGSGRRPLGDGAGTDGRAPALVRHREHVAARRRRVRSGRRRAGRVPEPAARAGARPLDARAAAPAARAADVPALPRPRADGAALSGVARRAAPGPRPFSGQRRGVAVRVAPARRRSARGRGARLGGRDPAAPVAGGARAPCRPASAAPAGPARRPAPCAPPRLVRPRTTPRPPLRPVLAPPAGRRAGGAVATGRARRCRGRTPLPPVARPLPQSSPVAGAGAERAVLHDVLSARLSVLAWELDEAERKERWDARHEICGPESGAWRRAPAALDGRVYLGVPADEP